MHAPPCTPPCTPTRTKRHNRTSYPTSLPPLPALHLDASIDYTLSPFHASPLPSFPSSRGVKRNAHPPLPDLETQCPPPPPKQPSLPISKHPLPDDSDDGPGSCGSRGECSEDTHLTYSPPPSLLSTASHSYPTRGRRGEPPQTPIPPITIRTPGLFKATAPHQTKFHDQRRRRSAPCREDPTPCKAGSGGGI